MTALFYITISTAFVAYIIHKLHAFPLILDCFRVEDEEPEKVQAPTTEPQRLTIPTRNRLEAEAGYIIHIQGSDSRTVKYMSNDMLLAIIRDFKGYTSE
jgi:hypothetical protein